MSPLSVVSRNHFSLVRGTQHALLGNNLEMSFTICIYMYRKSEYLRSFIFSRVDEFLDFHCLCHALFRFPFSSFIRSRLALLVSQSCRLKILFKIELDTVLDTLAIPGLVPNVQPAFEGKIDRLGDIEAIIKALVICFLLWRLVS
jgi:hypothetical protein